MYVVNKFGLKLEATAQTRWIFSLIGVWPMMTMNTTIVERRVSVVIYLICQSLLAFIIIPANIQLFLFESLEVKLAYFGPLGTAIACTLKYFAIINRQRKIKKCIEQIEEDWNHIKNDSVHAIMIENMKNGKRITAFCGSVMYGGGILHQIMMPHLPGSIVSIFTNSTKRLLVYPMCELMFDDQITPVYEILYVTHIIAGIVVCTIAVGSCHLAILFVTHTASLNQIMELESKNLMETEDEAKKNYHIFSHNVEDCLREVCLISILEAFYVICLAEYYSLLTWKHNETFGAIIYLILLQGFVGSFFIFCHVGEILKQQFKDTGEAIYMMEWYRLSYRNVRSLVLVIALTQRSPRITAGGLMELSYDGFVSVIKTTAAYFNMLRMTEF